MKNIVVLIDFTAPTEAALQHGLIMARKTESMLTLLHVVKDIGEQTSALEKMRQLASKYKHGGIEMRLDVQVGKIEDLALLAEAMQANLVYLGTHGLKGLQYLFGSKALQLISKSKVPYIIVQEPPAHMGIKNIVVPMDGTVEEKQILQPVMELAGKFQSKLHVFGAHYTDEFLQKKTTLNLQFTEKLLQKNRISYVCMSHAPKKTFLNDLLGYAEKEQADLIAIINHQEDGFKNLFGTHFDQAVMTNGAKIPVLVMNFTQIYHVVDLFTGMTKV